ncbi:MAG: Flp pilus assembly complex ATPase component TadA [Treponema sp.]|jgi:type IV secretion system protein VirB11|nr:Flp pilus assembly complex ATPase component TadA [Treponema sp.]
MHEAGTGLAANTTESSLAYFFRYFLDYTRDSEGLSELMVNPDGSLFIEKDGCLTDLETRVPPEKTLSFINLLAGYRGFVVDRDHPSVPMRLPGTLGGGRVQALIPPVVQGPTFSIRFPPKKRKTIDELVDTGTFNRVKYKNQRIRNHEAAELLKEAIAEKKTVLFAGATSSGKTTILNAFYGECITNERLFVIEDVPELIFDGNKNTVYLMTQHNYSTRDAVFDTMRLRPDRIIVGEIRDGKTAIELCKCFLTGHPGGASSIHADSARGALSRLKALMQEVVQAPDENLIKNAVDYVVFVNRKVSGNKIMREVEEIIDVSAVDFDYL